jgi:hypothetical protein
MYPIEYCTYYKKCGDDPAISTGVLVLYMFSVLAPWWENQESDRTEIWFVVISPREGYICTKFQVNSPSNYETCPANGRHVIV